MKKPTIDEWFAIQRGKARRMGYIGGVEELGIWSPRDREIYERYHPSMKILYVHGLSSSGTSQTASTLRNCLREDVVISPDLPIDPDEALELLRQIVSTQKIDLVIGSSMGGMLAQKLRGCPKILVNPAFHVSQLMRGMLGKHEFFSMRTDGLTEYEITEELCDRYECLEREQFGGLCNHEREITLGMFGRYDDVVDCSEEFKQHYHHVCYYDGGHRLSEEVIKELLVTKIEEFRAQMLD